MRDFYVILQKFCQQLQFSLLLSQVLCLCQKTVTIATVTYKLVNRGKPIRIENPTALLCNIHKSAWLFLRYESLSCYFPEQRCFSWSRWFQLKCLCKSEMIASSSLWELRNVKLLSETQWDVPVCAFFSINPQSSRSERIHSKCQPLSERALRKQNLALASCRSSRRSGCCSTLLTALHYFRHLPPAERKRLAPRLLLCIENKKICSDHTTQWALAYLMWLFNEAASAENVPERVTHICSFHWFVHQLGLKANPNNQESNDVFINIFF